MVTVHDVAAYILEKVGTSLSAMKLQKLVYYAQAWHLVWADEPLFESRIEAWANGPVVPELYRHHRGQYLISEWPHGNAATVHQDHERAASIDVVVDFYGELSASQLSDMTHRERPWLTAREGLAPGVRGYSEISTFEMADFYGAMLAAEGDGL